MKGVLVDTSVWVDHFRRNSGALVNLLLLDRVYGHPVIVGEIACGTPPERARTLADLEGLAQVRRASIPEAIDFIERERLYGLGCGLADMLLLTSALLSGVELWTHDKRLATLADRFGIQHRPAVH